MNEKNVLIQLKKQYAFLKLQEFFLQHVCNQVKASDDEKKWLYHQVSQNIEIAITRFKEMILIENISFSFDHLKIEDHFSKNELKDLIEEIVEQNQTNTIAKTRQRLLVPFMTKAFGSEHSDVFNRMATLCEEFFDAHKTVSVSSILLALRGSHTSS